MDNSIHTHGVARKMAIYFRHSSLGKFTELAPDETDMIWKGSKTLRWFQRGYKKIIVYIEASYVRDIGKVMKNGMILGMRKMRKRRG